MIINDRIYGKVKINSPVLIELIRSKPLQRLKGICQFGIPDKYYYLVNYYRYEHCVGVMILLNKLGATEEEQIAGLLHDVSHTAFSHVIDWVVSEGKSENYQDDVHEKFINSSKIPAILKKYGINPKRITNYHNFGLLEQTAPKLCADRVDYALREFSKTTAQKCLSSIDAYNNQIIFKNKQHALLFAANYMQKQTEHWGGFEASSRYRIFANALRKALSLKEITHDDFWKEDAHIIKKLEKSKDSEIQNILKILSKKSLKQMPKSKDKVFKKYRYVDPQYLEDGKIFTLSKESKTYKNILRKSKLINSKGTYLPLI
jgi:uncharacterized protein